MHREPNCIVTNQDHAHHWYCMWHIIKKVTSKVGHVLSHNEEFMSKINSVAWTIFLEPTNLKVGECLLCKSLIWLIMKSLKQLFLFVVDPYVISSSKDSVIQGFYAWFICTNGSIYIFSSSGKE
ncbi:unnamed protein product [Cuscuta epithymum]|uniref:Protein FAR1-RELATED SEQUENCE n=1 Tax=Cuscuta epithymum TaxID=186058 RepID=A0AAV0DAZ5_9ASTE|nr:unnamed protein product [Cuscuta epithymum]